MEEYFETKSIDVASENIEEKRKLYKKKIDEDRDRETEKNIQRRKTEEEFQKQSDLKAGMYRDMGNVLVGRFTFGNGPSLEDDKFKNIIQKYRNKGLDESILKTAYFYEGPPNENNQSFWKFGLLE